ncbi:MAG: hypothetical protein NC293_09390 [Roseburia sp.]|nr:hypothetical protein [Roseburia sp.]
MERLQNAYKKLYLHMNTKEGYRLNGKTVFLKDLSHFVGCKGEKYDSSAVKLLLVGRAVNGWSQFSIDSAEEFAKDAVMQFEDEPLVWIYDEEKGCLGNGNGYFLNKSPFWRTSREIWKKISNNVDHIDTANDKWTDYIAWTNLYKVAPQDGGNPTTTMRNDQLEACREILVAEVKALNPTHILFVTGYEGWFDEFEDIVHGDSIKIVTACRPEFRNETDYVKDICEKFGIFHGKNDVDI